ncbi:MAG: sulfatase [Planctomycetota bacterium]
MTYNRIGTATWLSILIVAAFSSSVQADAPNVVLFLVDDLGWADLGCYGSEFHETPHIDALAAESTRFTNAYAACPVCSPTRASILTGRHPVRVKITDWIPGMSADRVPDRKFEHVDDLDELPLAEVTLAELLKDAGYQTWFLGKWHLGDDGFLPTDQGFDVNVGGCEKGSPPGGYYAPWKNPNLTAKQKGEYLTTRLTDEAIDRIGDSGDAPFFMMLSYYNVHTPITADKRTIDAFRKKAADTFDRELPAIAEREALSRSRQDNPEYASMVAAVDTSVGRVLQQLKQRGIDDDTLILFFSDNGGLCTSRRMGPTCNLPLRSGKGWLYEGGIREPFLIRLPKAMRAAPGTDSDVIAISTDIAPTVLDLVGLPPRDDLHLDGQSLRPILSGDGNAVQAARSRTAYWHYPHYHGSTWAPGAAIRQGRYKLIEFWEEDCVELYDLQSDLAESNDLTRTHPEVREALQDELHRWQSSLGATMPQRR